MGLRVFLAVPIFDGAVIDRLRALLDELRSLRGVRPVPPHQLHFTLKFFEDLDEGKLPAVRSAAERAAAGTSSFSLNLSGLGTFPPRAPARVLWVGCGEGAGALMSLARRVEGEFTLEGFPPEGRSFSPHRGAAAFAAAHASFDAGALDVKELVLYQSVLGPDGAAHIPLGRFRLESGARS
jgi:2'-5' RNA ligase